MNGLMNEMAADADRPVVDAKAAMVRIAEMVRLREDAARRVEAADAALKREKETLLRMDRVDLPELLRESGVEEITLSDGTKVCVNDDINCNISEERAPAAHAWLREHGYGSVIKLAVVAMFGKDEVKLADKLYSQLVSKYGDKVTEKENVHPQTLKALLKELMAQQVAFPLELFGVAPYSIAKITRRKS